MPLLPIPQPWYKTDFTRVVDESGETVAYCPPRPAHPHDLSGGHEAASNASFIVQACSYHEVLLHTCDALLDTATLLRSLADQERPDSRKVHWEAVDALLQQARATLRDVYISG